MRVFELVDSAKDTLTARRVYGDPVERDGLVLVPAAAIAGGAGGGGDPSEHGGQGGGFGVRARPVGAYVIQDGTVTWRPAIDVDRAVMAAAVVAVVYLLARRG